MLKIGSRLRRASRLTQTFELTSTGPIEDRHVPVDDTDNGHCDQEPWKHNGDKHNRTNDLCESIEKRPYGVSKSIINRVDV